MVIYVVIIAAVIEIHVILFGDKKVMFEKLKNDIKIIEEKLKDQNDTSIEKHE